MNTRYELPEHDEVLDLMSVRAIEGLSDAEEAKLARLLKDFDATGDELDLAAAAFDCALSEDLAPELPGDLRRRVLDVAPNARNTLEAGPSVEARGFPFEWAVAAAAVILAVVAWIPRFSSSGDDPALPTATATPVAMMETLIADADDVMQIPWSPLEEPGYEGVRGEVVWSSARQEGYLRLSGLPDPGEKQYQLWIVDGDRDPKHPVDGGVIDYRPATVGGEVVVPIRAALDCPSPDVFALTLERPGGVVVSAGPLLVAATPPK